MSRHLHNRAGFSLAELMIALTILGIVVASTFGLIFGVQRQHFRNIQQTRAEDNLRVADLMLRAVLRTAGADPFMTNQAVFDPQTTSNFDRIRVTADFNPPDRDFADAMEDVLLRVIADTLMVRWRAGTSLEAFAYPVDSLSLAFFDRGGSQLTTRAAIQANTMRVRFRLIMHTDPANPTKVLRRESWVYLRNRR